MPTLFQQLSPDASFPKNDMEPFDQQIHLRNTRLQERLPLFRISLPGKQPFFAYDDKQMLDFEVRRKKAKIF